MLEEEEEEYATNSTVIGRRKRRRTTAGDRLLRKVSHTFTKGGQGIYHMYRRFCRTAATQHVI
jgi:hypothetical protein